MSKMPKIDVTKNVMDKIKNESIEMKPKSYYKDRQTFKNALYIASVIGGIVAIAGLTLTIRTNVFVDFLDYGQLGAEKFLATLPWFGIVFATLACFTMYRILKGKDFRLNQKTYPAAVLVLALIVVGVGFGKLMPTNSRAGDLFARISHVGTQKQTKVIAKIESVQGNMLSVKLSGDESKQVDLGFSISGDKLLPGAVIEILGVEKESSIEAFHISLLIEAPEKVEVKSVVKEKPKKKIKKEKKEEPEEEVAAVTEVKPVAVRKVEPNKETKPPDTTAKITLASKSVSGDVLTLNFNISKSFTGWCKVYMDDGLYGYTEVTNATSCSVVIDVTGKTGEVFGYAKLKDYNGNYISQTPDFLVNL